MGNKGSGRISRLRRSKIGVVAVAGLAIFVDMLLYTVLLPIQPRILEASGVVEKELNYYQVMLSSVYSLGLFVATPIFGVISDKYCNRQIPLLGGLLALTSSIMMFAFVRNIVWLIVARILMGISAGATWVLGFAMLSDTFSSDDGLGMAIAAVMTCHTLGGFAGPLVGGFLGQYFGLQYPFYFCASLTLLDFIIRLFIKPPPPKTALSSDPSPKDGSKKALSGYLSLLRNKDLLLSLFSILIMSASYSSLEILMPTWLQSSPWSFDEFNSGLIMLSFILPTALVSFLTGRLSERFSRVWLIMIGLLLHGISAPLPFSARNTAQLIVFCIFFGATAPIISSATSTHMAAIVDKNGGKSYARMYALFNMTWSAGSCIGPNAVQFVTSVWSLSVGMLIISSCCFIFIPILYLGSSSEALTLGENCAASDSQCTQSDEAYQA